MQFLEVHRSSELLSFTQYKTTAILHFGRIRETVTLERKKKSLPLEVVGLGWWHQFSIGRFEWCRNCRAYFGSSEHHRNLRRQSLLHCAELARSQLLERQVIAARGSRSRMVANSSVVKFEVVQQLQCPLRTRKEELQRR